MFGLAVGLVSTIARIWLVLWLPILMQGQRQVSVATEHVYCSLLALAMAEGVADVVAN